MELRARFLGNLSAGHEDQFLFLHGLVFLQECIKHEIERLCGSVWVRHNVPGLLFPLGHLRGHAWGGFLYCSTICSSVFHTLRPNFLCD